MGTWKNLERKREYIKHRWQFGKFLLDLSKAAPCSDCKGRYPTVCMDWDHVGTKTANVSKLTHHRPSKLFEEIAKCELVCANCHRVRTNERL